MRRREPQLSVGRGSTSPERGSLGSPAPTLRSANRLLTDAPPRATWSRLRWEGDLGTLFGLTIKNLILSVLTLGIYSFWGKTAERRYVWSHLEVDGDRLEYAGTGGELFLSFLVAMCAFVLPIVALQVFLGFFAAAGQVGLAGFLFANVLSVVFVVAFIAYARFTGLRYRLSRTSWRGVRFAVEGSLWPYVGACLVGAIAVAGTLGLLYPQMWLMAERLRLGKIAFGSMRMDLRVEGASPPYAPFLVAWLAGAVAVPCLALLPIKSDATAIVAALVFLALYARWKAAMMRFLAQRALLGGCRLRTNVSAGGLAALEAWNYLIILCTFGIARAVAIDRNMRFLDKHARIGPSEALAAAAQTTARRPRRGEGLLDALDAGIA